MGAWCAAILCAVSWDPTGSAQTSEPSDELAPVTELSVVAGGEPGPTLVPAWRKHEFTAAGGDSLYGIFTSHGFNLDDLARLLMADEFSARRLKRLPEGQRIEIITHADNRIAMLILPLANGDAYYFMEDGDEYTVEHSAYAEVRAGEATLGGGVVRDSGRMVATPAGLRAPHALQTAADEQRAESLSLDALHSGAQLNPEIEELASDQLANARHINEGQIMDAKVSETSLQIDDSVTQAAETELDSLVDRLTDEEATESVDAATQLSMRSVAVAKGDSLYSIFDQHGLPHADLDDLLSSTDLARALQRLYPGQVLDFYLDGSNTVAKLVYHIDDTHALHATREGARFRARVEETALEPRVVTATGTISTSLFFDAQRAGIPDYIIMQLVKIFAWDIDFALDIHAGDRFTVVYEDRYKGGKKVKHGNIVAAEFKNRGKLFRAIRYVGSNGRAEYYTPEGLSLRQAFLRTPVNFARISSKFNLRRRHPVLHKIRAHRGVDYAAATGTPVKASGAGKVIFAGRKGGYGKTVVLKHGSVYTTLYGHLSRIGKGVKKGAAVRQGQVIGYVGKTGLATGPHLHYELRVRGVQRDPLKVELPRAAPIPAEHKDDFLAHAKAMSARLDVLARQTLAASP